MDSHSVYVLLVLGLASNLFFITVTSSHIQNRKNSGQINSVGTRNIPSSIDQSPSSRTRQQRQQVFISGPNTQVSFERRRWNRRRYQLQKWRQQLADQRRKAIRRRPHTHVVDQNGVVLGIAQGAVNIDARPTPKVARLTIPISTGPQGKVKSDVRPTIAKLSSPHDRIADIGVIPTSAVSKHLSPLRTGIQRAVNVNVRPTSIVTKQHIPTSVHQQDMTKPMTAQVLNIGNGVIREPSPTQIRGKLQPLVGDQSQNINKARLTDTPQVPQTPTENLSILQLLNDRQPVINDKVDEVKLKNHLLTLSQMQRTKGLVATDQRLIRMQLEYIYTIQESAIKREVLKLFVKDIVEKSGFLSASQQTNADIVEMASLFELIQSISANRSTPITPSTTRPRANELTSKINLGLNMNNYQRPSKTPQQLPSLDMDNLVGLSIYGDRPETRTGSGNELNNGGTKAAIVTTMPTSTFNPKFEPLGGNNAYWTHLSVGFQDMLCALCQRQNKQACINKYCQNDVNV